MFLEHHFRLQNSELKTKTSVSEVFVFNGLSQDHYPHYNGGRKKAGDVFNGSYVIYRSVPEFVIAGLDPAISPAQGIPASGRGNDIVSYKSKLELKVLIVSL